MTVGELIKELKKYDPDLPVLVEGIGGDDMEVYCDTDGVFIGAQDAIDEIKEGM